MTYPDGIDVFSEKLNKKQDGLVYVIEEEITITDGVFEGILKHDNISVESISIHTEPNFAGEKVENYFISTPSETPWKKQLKVYSNTPKVYVIYETTGDQVEAEDVNVLQDAITNTQTEIERYKTTNAQTLEGIDVRVNTLESNKTDKTYVDTEILKKADKVITYTKAETDDRIRAVIGAAPEALDTLQEIADALNNDPDFAGTITNELSKKIDKVSGKQLSTEDYTTTEKTKLAGIETGANKYVHPAAHSADMITETTTKKVMTDTERFKLAGIETGAQINAVISVAGKTGVVTLTKSDVGLADIDNTADIDKPISTATQTALNGKVDNSRVLTSVPTNAKFTDTLYTHPTNHPPTIIAQDANNRFVTDAEKANWNSKETSGAKTWNDLKGV